jgi:hypothetical protein
VRPIFITLPHSSAFGVQRVGQQFQAQASKSFLDFAGNRHVNRRGERVVRALSHVHVVVRVDRLLGQEPIAATDLDRPIRDDLVDVHVARRAGTGLKHVDGKLAVEFSIGHLATGGQQRFDLLRLKRILARPRQFVEVSVGHRAGVLHVPHRMDQRRRQRPTGNRKVLDGSLRLSAVVGLGGNEHIAHRVTLSSGVGHGKSQCLCFVLADSRRVPMIPAMAKSSKAENAPERPRNRPIRGIERGKREFDKKFPFPVRPQVETAIL